MSQHMMACINFGPFSVSTLKEQCHNFQVVIFLSLRWQALGESAVMQ